MSVRKLTASLLTVLVLLGGVASVDAQEYVPVADPFAFDPDFRWFEPVYDVDLADMKPDKRAHDGWFATYDRLNLYASRPEVDEPDVSETKIDGGWGWRYEVGYMLPGGEDNGWLFNWTHNNVGAFAGFGQERLNRYNGDQLIGAPAGAGVTAPPFGTIVRQLEANNLGYNYRWVLVGDIENNVGYDSYELNKTWRMEPYHYGGILEPLVGVRWMRVDDTRGIASYQNSLENPPLVGPNFTDAELYTTANALTENEMFGGQLGFRYMKFRERFTFSSDFRVFFGGNWQCSRSQVVTELTTYSGNAAGDPVLNIFDSRTEPIYSRNEEFFVGFDVRGEIGYQLTRMISLRGGFQLIDIGKGVWRGGDGTVVAGGDNDQDLLLVGGTFGINLNH